MQEWRFGRYIGKGSFGFVYEIFMNNLKNGLVHACKVILKESLRDPEAKQKLMNEIKIHK